MLKIDGTAIARKIIDALKKLPRPTKNLVAVLVGASAASLTFIRRKAAVARELGIGFELFQFSVTDTEDAMVRRIRALSCDERVGGIVLQLPLPERFCRDALIAVIVPHKDPDNLTGRAGVHAPAVGAVKEIFKDSGFRIQDARIIAVVGRGFLVGAPIIQWLEYERHKIQDSGFKIQDLQIKVADIDTDNVKECVADADVVITGVGKAGCIDLRWLQDGVGIIDFGFPADIDNSTFNTQHSTVSFYTPTPGGTGPIVVAKLLENFYTLNCG